MSPAALADMEKLEAYHLQQEVKYKNKGNDVFAYTERKMAETVRVCIVTIQAAESREAKNAKK